MAVQISSQQQQQQHARKPSIPSRPTTPLRSTSRTSFRASQTTPSASNNDDTDTNHFPLQRLEPAFAELSESMADLEANFMHLQLLNESMARFNENFAAFLYGLNMTAFCVDFPEAPIQQSFARHGSNTCQLGESPFISRPQATEDQQRTIPAAAAASHDATFLTTDTSFVENPPMSSNKSSYKYASSHAPPPPASTKSAATSRRGVPTVRGTHTSSRGRVAVAGTDANGRRVTRMPSARGSNVRGRGGRGKT